MLTMNSRGARQVTAAAAVAGAALLVTPCSSSSSSPTAASSPASTPASATPAGSPSVPASSASASSAPATSATAATPSASPSVTTAQTAASTFLATGQDVNGTALYRPACNSNFGCQLSGDSTAFLDKMTWSVWSVTEAVGTGTIKLDDCNPNCAVATVITLGQPGTVCSSWGTRWFWSRASFKYPNGLPKALQSDGGPQNPWNFSSVASAANQGCSG